MNGVAVVIVGTGSVCTKVDVPDQASPELSSLLTRTRQYSVVPTGKIVVRGVGRGVGRVRVEDPS